MESQATLSYSGSIPKIYDDIQGPAYFEPYAIETAMRVAALHPQTILEIAAGTGRVTNHLQKNLPESFITATDISADMLAIAKEKLSGAKNIQWQIADALSVPFADNSFDAVVCQFGVMFFADKAKGFAEAFRVLKKNGILFLATWDKLSLNPIAASGRQVIMDFFENNPPQQLKTAFSMADKNELQRLLEQAGFVDIMIESVTKPCEAESAKNIAYAQVDGSIVANFIREKDANAIPILRKKIADIITEKFGNHPISTMQAILITAEKQ